jgi:hypothetical protein
MRFFDEENDEFKEIDKFFGMNEDDDDELMAGQVVHIFPTGEIGQNIHQNALIWSIRLAEKSFTWKFKSYKKKVEIVKFIYNEFLKMLEEELKETEKEK